MVLWSNASCIRLGGQGRRSREAILAIINKTDKQSINFKEGAKYAAKKYVMCSQSMFYVFSCILLFHLCEPKFKMK